METYVETYVEMGYNTKKLQRAYHPALSNSLLYWLSTRRSGGQEAIRASCKRSVDGGLARRWDGRTVLQWLHNGNPWKSIDFLLFFKICGGFSRFLVKYEGLWSK